MNADYSVQLIFAYNTQRWIVRLVNTVLPIDEVSAADPMTALAMMQDAINAYYAGRSKK